ncbi:Spc98 family-domain-containing protein [Daldinia decipiens]|uniref:Spc98 family-domain-containing protein n=1 Tax=Daldinia decipiens TaxID=326647 RepID=UPI0020C4E055|nr:Spc98 family-domain-containing protein [Daldinia decipiens]KAI1658457.1 Spc98 family-domain-containing protein [Daldinia decipiens]
MLHEILLSLSGHPSPLLRNDYTEPRAQSILSPPERELLRTAGHLSDLHCKLISYTAQVSASHPSIICRAVSTAINSLYLAAFQRKVLEVEESILRKDASLVGAYNIVPLTAVIGEFSEWTRRMEWLWNLVQFMLKENEGSPCRAAQLINKLRDELQTGYADIGETALSLVRVAETAWLKQVSAWVLYGTIPILGDADFFIQKNERDELGYSINQWLLPSFVTASAATSMLFIGTSLNRVKTRSSIEPSSNGLGHLSSQLQTIADLKSPLNSAAFSRAITSIRLTLSRTILQKLLPLSRVLEMLVLFRDFFLLGRGEFAMALTQQADEVIHNRWRRADNLAYEKRVGLGNVMVKEGEVAAVLTKTWTVLGSMQGQHADEDEGLEKARDVLRLNLSKTKALTPVKGKTGMDHQAPTSIADTPFRNLLFSVPVVLTSQIPPPLDLFLTASDVQIYTSINSYLLSIRRSHLHLTGLWKITALRRHHPAPPRPPYSTTRSGASRTRVLRERSSIRSSIMRSAWSTSSAAIFFLAETEAYLQVEVVEGLWEDFHGWIIGKKSHEQHDNPNSSGDTCISNSNDSHSQDSPHNTDNPPEPDRTPQSASPPHHDPQTLAIAHRLYLRTLIRRLLLTQSSFTNPLYELLVNTDHLVALVHRLHGVWAAADLEADEGVVDAFADLVAEEADVRMRIREVEAGVKDGVRAVVAALRALSTDSAFMAELEDGGLDGEEDNDVGNEVFDEEGIGYRPRRTGGIDRLLMKLDFGGWFDAGIPRGDEGVGDDEF